MTQMPSPHGPFVSHLSPARVPFVWANFCYAVVSCDRRSWKREVELTARVMLLTIGGVGGVTTLGWYLMRFVSMYRYRKLMNDRLEALELGARIQSACCS